jgi:hypothetical protein
MRIRALLACSISSVPRSKVLVLTRRQHRKKARSDRKSSGARPLVSRRAALAGFAIAAASGSAVAEQVSDSKPGENGAGPTLSPSGPNAELYGAAEGYPIADRSLAHQPGEPHQIKYRVGAYSHIDEIFRRTGSSVRLHRGSSNARQRTSAIIFAAINRPYQNTFRAILLRVC